MSEYVSSSPTPSGTADAGDASAKDKAMESAQAGKQAAGDVAQTAVNKAQDVVGEGKAQARDLVGEARDQLRGHAGEQQRNAVSSLRSFADELHSMARSGQQSDQQSGVATDLVSKTADRAHGAASWLDGREPEDLVDELRRFARRRPGAFLAGAVVAGVLAGRLTRGAVAAHTDDNDNDNGASQRPSYEPLPGGVEDPGQHAYGSEYGSQLPPGQYGSQLPPGQYDGQVPPGQYGGQVAPGQYGGQVPPDQYGGQVAPGQYGGQVPPGQYGGQGAPGQYGGQVPPGQYGGQPGWDPGSYPGPGGAP